MALKPTVITKTINSGSSTINQSNYMNNRIMEQKLEYLHNNPVMEGYVFEPHEYKYSIAIDYVGGKGFVNVVLIE
ncbi:MAG: hypothetical protein JXB34_09115 [Bacteroidales bacterium]|nr:hypothetical protein [Bacteroidales bacterium]